MVDLHKHISHQLPWPCYRTDRHNVHHLFQLVCRIWRDIGCLPCLYSVDNIAGNESYPPMNVLCTEPLSISLFLDSFSTIHLHSVCMAISCYYRQYFGCVYPADRSSIRHFRQLRTRLCRRTHCSPLLR